MIVPTTLRWPRKCELLGERISVTTYEETTEAVLRAAQARQSAIVSAHPVHALVTANRDPALRAVVNQFEIITPDGQPVRWALNLLHRAGLTERVCGPELMLRICRRAAEEGLGIYLYGSTPDVIDALRANLLVRFPRLRIAGAESPPFRTLSPAEDQEMVGRVNQSGARIMFLGLGFPKQDHFAHEHRGRIRAVQVCVGAAFDFHAGAIPRAPRWMQRFGLEWCHRLAQEPRRLWRRYLVTNTIFMVRLGFAVIRRTFGKHDRSVP